MTKEETNNLLDEVDNYLAGAIQILNYSRKRSI